MKRRGWWSDVIGRAREALTPALSRCTGRRGTGGGGAGFRSGPGVRRVEGGAVGAEDGEEAEGVAPAVVVVLGVEALERVVGGLEHEDVEAGVGGVVDLVLAAGEFGGEG